MFILHTNVHLLHTKNYFRDLGFSIKHNSNSDTGVGKTFDEHIYSIQVVISEIEENRQSSGCSFM